MYDASLVIKNLKNYMFYIMEIADRKLEYFDDFVLVVNGSSKSIFNYVFLREGSNELNEVSVRELISYLKKRGISVTWPVENHTLKSEEILKRLGCSNVSSPKKSLLKIDNYLLNNNSLVSDLQFCIVNNKELLELFDLCTSQIFHHDVGDVVTFLKGLLNYSYDDSKLKFFLVRLNGIVVGTCGLYIQDEVAGFYSDGVFLKYRNRGIASQMVLNRIKIAKDYGCRYAIAHCMKASVNLYKRLGFKILGSLPLYVS